jgi:hypothetical protein
MRHPVLVVTLAASLLGLGVLVLLVLWPSEADPGPSPAPHDPASPSLDGYLDLGPDRDMISGSDCVARILHCGDQVKGDTLFGRSTYNTPWWRQAGCAIAPGAAYSGRERIYRLVIGVRGRVDVHISKDSWSDALHLMAYPWPHESCPTLDSGVSACEVGVLRTDRSHEVEEIDLVVSAPADWLVAVDGPDNHGVPFSLEVSCLHDDPW